MILSSLTAPRSSSVGPSVPVSPIFVLRTVVVFALAHQCNSSSGILLCADAQLCAELQVRLRSEREISDIQWWGGERRTKGGGRRWGKSSCFSPPPPSTHTQRGGGEEKQTEASVGGGRFCCFQWRLGQRALGLCVSYKVQSQCCCHWPWGSRWDGCGATM